MYKYQLDPRGRKFPCPKCGKKKLVRYVDADNNFLPEIFGKCERKFSCGYFKKPDQQVVIDLRPIRPQIKLPTSFTDESIVQKTLSHYQINSLFNYLKTTFDKELVLQTFLKYRVGTSKQWGGSPIFWQTDLAGKVRGGKVIKYINGKRAKNTDFHTTWSHKLMRINGYNLVQVMFGTHLLNSYDGDIVFVVESEKTALVMDMFIPGFLWLSIGSCQMLNYERLKFLKGYNIILYPDTDGASGWRERAEVISEQMGQKVEVSELVSNLTIMYDKSGGFDLADLVLEQIEEMKKPKESELMKAIQRLIAKNQAVKLLINTFDLDIETAALTDHKLRDK